MAYLTLCCWWVFFAQWFVSCSFLSSPGCHK